jgi:hypothetical protein
MRRTLASLALAAAAAALLAPAGASAIPAFARRYRFSCTTCHAVFPQLRPYGEEFAARGFALPEGQEPASASIDAGDSLLSLPRDFPIALRFDAFALASDEGPATDLQAPWILKILTGGKIAPKVSWYGYFIIEEGEVIGFEDAFVQFSNVFSLPVNVIAGQFQISDPIMKRELRLERLDYEILRVRVGASPVNLTYDRGVAVAAGLPFVDAVAMVTNGTGLSTGGRFDVDGFKSYSLDLATEVGPLRLAAFGYYGKGRDPSGLGGEVNTTWMAGPHADLAFGEKVKLTAAWIERRDSNPFFLAADADTATGGGFLEATWMPQGWNGRWALVGLYNFVESDDDLADRHSAGVAAGWLFRRNVRLVAEVDRDIENEVWAASVGTVAAF